jgi:hypothetical protein
LFCARSSAPRIAQRVVEFDRGLVFLEAGDLPTADNFEGIIDVEIARAGMRWAKRVGI